MEMKILTNKKGVLELEFDEKTLPEVLCAELQKKGVDAYAYEEHPLLTGYKLHIEDKEPMKKLKLATSQVDKDWKSLRKSLEKKIPKK